MPGFESGVPSVLNFKPLVFFPCPALDFVYNRLINVRTTLLIATIRACVNGQKTCQPLQFQASAAFQHPSAGMPR